MRPLRVVLLALLLSSCARDLVDGQTQVGDLRTGVGLLTWEADRGGPRQMTPSVRESITDSLLRGEREVAFAARSGQSEGLRDLFAQAALDDARAVAGQGAALSSWGHRVTLHFYAPDGATVSLTDRHWYLIPEGTAALRVAQRTQDLVLQLDDGNWRVHHVRVLRDEALPPPAPPGPGPLVRAVRFGPDDLSWMDRSEDQWARDLSAVRELQLDTLILPLDLRPGVAESARPAAALDRVGRAARARGVQLLLQVRFDALSPRSLRALHGALGTGERPPGLAGVLLLPDRAAPDETVRLWRQTLQARFGVLPLGLTAHPSADFSWARAAVFRERPWPLGLLSDVRRTWQLRAFVRARPQGNVEVGALYGTRGLLTPDGSFTRLSRALTRPDERPGALAFVWGWVQDLWPLAFVAVAAAWWARRFARRRAA